MHDVSARTCTLCGKPNHCAIANSEPVGSCWCLTTTFSDEVKLKLSELDPGVCICRTCATEKGDKELEG